MARPIEPTPALEGADATALLASLDRGVPTSPQRLEQARQFVREVEQGKTITLKPRQR